MTTIFKNIMSLAITLFIVYMVIDVASFLMWAVSGQTPVDNFFIGGVTATIIKTAIALL